MFIIKSNTSTVIFNFKNNLEINKKMLVTDVSVRGRKFFRLQVKPKLSEVHVSRLTETERGCISTIKKIVKCLLLENFISLFIVSYITHLVFTLFY